MVNILLTEIKEGSKDTYYYEFWQLKIGNFYLIDEFAGLGKLIFIEAFDYNQANKILFYLKNRISTYLFSYRFNEVDESTGDPQIPIKDFLKSDYLKDCLKKSKVAFIHNLNGSIKKVEI